MLQLQVKYDLWMYKTTRQDSMSLSVTDTNSAGKLSSAGCPHSDYTEKGINWERESKAGVEGCQCTESSSAGDLKMV